MIDHLIGRPSVTLRKYQVFTVVFLWSIYLLRGDPHGLPGLRWLSKLLSKRMTAWHTVLVFSLWLYVGRNFGKLVGLECPEPLAGLYNRSFFRATWFLTALDAGFWSAMHIKRKWLRDLCSVIFAYYYLICAEQADEKVRKVRSVLTVEHLRVSWNKSVDNPYLAALGKLVRPSVMRYPPREIRIPRPHGSSYHEPVKAWLYFNGPISALKRQDKVVLYIHGGGFVAMSPRTHDDALFAWAGKTGLPILAVDYGKAPEHPYPYGLNECFDVYRTLMHSNGRCIGLEGDDVPSVVLAGDSAGGNFAAGVTLMVLEWGSTENRRYHGEKPLPTPDGLVLIYPALELNIGNWMTDEQMALIKDRHARKTNKPVLQRKKSDFHRRAPSTPLPSDDEDDSSPMPEDMNEPQRTPSAVKADASAAATRKAVRALAESRVAVPSLMSYVNDRILTPEMLRAMIILYIGPHSKPDFASDFLLCPVRAPDTLLARFPKTYFMTGERDPLVDDTVIFAGRLRAARMNAFRERKEIGLEKKRRELDDRDIAEVKIIEGISHGFLQFCGPFPQAYKYINQIGRWYETLFAKAGSSSKYQGDDHSQFANGHGAHHRRTGTGGSSIDEDSPLEMSKVSRPPRRDSYVPNVPDPNDESAPSTPGHSTGTRRSLVSLTSDDDIVGRRMRGIVGSLTRKYPDAKDASSHGHHNSGK